ncbi:hypothetical protein V496_07245 [Pseudogymnoascus sp. VKM F-4515 (FW-2607)]|nr:hypothetical protein V496_07245 [Pseudogymnoascus sp. VKM F-4515 (FW-2607)]
MDKESHDVAISISQQNSEGRYTADIPDLSGSIDSIVDEEAIESDNEESISTSYHCQTPCVHHYQGEEGPRAIIHEHSIISCATRGQDQLATNHRTIIISPQLSNIAAPIISAPGPEKASLAPPPPQKSPASTITDGIRNITYCHYCRPWILTVTDVVFILLNTSDQQHPPIRTQVSASVQHEVNSTKEARYPVVSSAEGAKSLRGSMQRNSLSDARRRPEQKKKSFFKEVATRTIEQMSDDVFETDDGIDESAIDDDESLDWEDLMEKSGKSCVDNNLSFPRGCRTPECRVYSGITRLRPPSPRGLSPFPESDDSAPLTMTSRMRPRQEVPRAGAQPISMTTTNVTPHQAALSPKTTRRQMLATELTASLRRHLLWERKQKNQTASTVLKRRHTAHDVANLKQYPDKLHLEAEDKGDHGSWNQYFGQGLGEYHSKSCQDTVARNKSGRTRQSPSLVIRDRVLRWAALALAPSYLCNSEVRLRRILSIVQSFFGDDPCVLGHCLRYGAYPGHILCFRSGGGPQVLVVHLLAKESQVCYYGGSHQHELPVEEGKRLLYETTPSELDAKDCIPVEWKFPRGGLAVFDARLFFEIEKGYAITYEFATAEVVQNWKKMFLPSSKELKEKLVELEDHLEDRKIRMNFAFGDTT